MLSYEDCEGLCGVDPTTIDALARLHHLPSIVALEEGAFLVNCPEGLRELQRALQSQLRRAERQCRPSQVAHLRVALQHCQTPPR